MPLILRDLVNFSAARAGSAAIQMEDGLGQRAEELVDSYTPTHSAIRVLTHLDHAVLPAANASERAMIWHGRYGSGKSHLAVLVGHLLRHGADTLAWRGFRQRLTNMGATALAERLRYTFLSKTDPEHRPYLLVPLYASAGPTLAAALMAGLYKEIQAVGLNPDDLLPRTEFTVAGERFTQMIEHSPTLGAADLTQWGLATHYLTTQELKQGLAAQRPEALETFKAWYPKINHGSQFDPLLAGGLGVVECYQEAARNLAVRHQYAGIAVLWDELGHALEELFTTSARSPANELMLLQQFVEKTCTPPLGHVLFIGLTHYDLPEYAQRTHLDPALTDRLHTVSGRFSRDFRVELRAAEAEGYHLIGAQIGHTDHGQTLLANPKVMERRQKLVEVCAQLAVFTKMSAELPNIAQQLYPFHPLTVAGLLAVATYGQFAQANRTVFTFLRTLLDACPDLENLSLDVAALYSTELIRLPALLTVYREAMHGEAELLKVLHEHDRAVAQITAAPLDPIPRALRLALIETMTLGKVLGKDLQPTRALLAAALYDAPDSVIGPWSEDLEWLRSAGLAYESAHTGVWQLQGDQGVDLEELIQKAEAALGENPQVHTLLQRPSVLEDLLPHIGAQNLDPSPAGIVRTFYVRLCPWPRDPTRLKIEHTLWSAQVFLTLPADAGEAARIISECQRLRDPHGRLIYLWVPMQGVAGLLPFLRRYLALDNLLAQPEAFSEGLLIRLRDQWESARVEVLQQLAERFGRKGLEPGHQTIRIFCSSNWTQPLNETVTIRSWHGFVHHLTQQVNELYPQEIQVRAMNVNQLCPDKLRTLTNLTDLLHSILHFSEMPLADRNDLLGLKDTSENAAVIDGLFGIHTNRLFEQRAEGWHLKAPKDVTGAAGEVLQFIEQHVTAKRERPASMKELREKLLAPPYGIPVQVLPLLVAVALREYRPRLTWENPKGKKFEDMLAEAFLDTSGDTRLRWEDFNSKERGALFLLDRAMTQFKIQYPSELEESKEAASVRRVQDYFKWLSPEVRRILPGKDRTLLERYLESPPHEFAQALVESLNTASELKGCTGDPDQCPKSWSQIENLVRNLVEAPERRAKEVRNILRDQLQTTLAELPEDVRSKITDHLSLPNQDNLRNAFAPIITAASPITDEQIDNLIQIGSGKNATDCTDLAMGELTGRLKAFLVPPPPIIKPTREQALTTIQDYLRQQAIPEGWDLATLREVLSSNSHRELAELLGTPATEPMESTLIHSLYQKALGNGIVPDYSANEIGRIQGILGTWLNQAQHDPAKGFAAELYKIIMGHYRRGLDKEKLLKELRNMISRVEGL